MRSIYFDEVSVFGDGFCAFTDRVFGQFTRQQETNSSLDFATRYGRTFVVVSQARGFRGNTFKNVVDEGVHDTHDFARDSSVWMDLLQDLEDADGIQFLPLLKRPSLLPFQSSR